MTTDEIRELAASFSAEQLERCLEDELTTDTNECTDGSDVADVVNRLAEAEFVRVQVEAGTPIREAIRELARRMRAVQQRTP